MTGDISLRAAIAFAEWPRQRMLLIVAHPDDETVCASAMMQMLRDSLLLVHVSDGAPVDSIDATRAGCSSVADYSMTRERELAAALQVLGLSDVSRRRLEFSERGLSLRVAELRDVVASLFRECRPQIVVTHPYERGHPDHDTVAAAVHAVVRGSEAASRPVLLEFAGYHAGTGGLRTLEFLDDATTPTIVHPVTGEHARRKERALACFVMQQQVLSQLPLGPERYRRAPCYDFWRPPHDGALQYERWWPGEMSGPEWRTRVVRELFAVAEAAPC
jgi:N-acetylglucosamine malate deacetylase 2